MAKSSATYDVAISFAGEDRELASQIAAGLTENDVNVFYDEYAKNELWGKDLYSHLTQIYRDDSKFCLMLLSKNYAAKQWTTHERRAAQARAFTENREYILPLRLDDASVDGILETTGYIDVRKTSVREVIDLLLQKVRALNLHEGIRYSIIRAFDVLRSAGIHGRDGYTFRDSDLHTCCPTCGTQQDLERAVVSLDGADTIYTCINGCQAIVVVSKPGLVAWPGRGFRLGTHVLRNAAELRIKNESMALPVVVPASKAALMRSRPTV